MYLARELTDATLPAIGRAFGGRNHTTVLHACTAHGRAHRRRRRAPTRPSRRSTARSRRAAMATAAPDRLRRSSTACTATLPARTRRSARLVHIIHSPMTTDLLDSEVSRSDEALDSRATPCSPSCRPSPASASTRSAVQALSGVQLARRPDGAIELRATDMEIGLRVPLEARGRARRRRRAPGAAAARRRPRAARPTRCRSSCAPAEQDVEIVSGAATFHIRTLRAEDFPPFPEPEGDGARRRAGRARSSRRSLKVARSASRDETRPVLTGILVSAVGQRAAHGRDRLLPAVASRRRSSRRRWRASFEANVPARALQELARIVQHAERRGAARSACARTRSCSRSAASCCRRG